MIEIKSIFVDFLESILKFLNLEILKSANLEKLVFSINDYYLRLYKHRFVFYEGDTVERKNWKNRSETGLNGPVLIVSHLFNDAATLDNLLRVIDAGTSSAIRFDQFNPAYPDSCRLLT